MSRVRILLIFGIATAGLVASGVAVLAGDAGDRPGNAASRDGTPAPAQSGDGKPAAGQSSKASPSLPHGTAEGDQTDVRGPVETTLARETRQVVCTLSALSIQQLTGPSGQVPRSDSLRDAVPLLEEQIATWQQVAAAPTLTLVIRRASALSSSWQRELESYDQGDGRAARVAQQVSAARFHRLSAAIAEARRPVKDCRV